MAKDKGTKVPTQTLSPKSLEVAGLPDGRPTGDHLNQSAK